MQTEPYSLIQILVALLAAAGGVTGIVKVFTVSVRLWERRRKTRLDSATKQLNNAVEIKRIVAEANHIDDEAVKLALWKIIEERKEEISALKERVMNLEQTHSMSPEIRKKIYQALWNIWMQVNLVSGWAEDCESLSEKDQQALTNEIQILRGRISELEQILP